MKRLGQYSFSPLRDNLVNMCCCLLVEDNLFAPSSLVRFPFPLHLCTYPTLWHLPTYYRNGTPSAGAAAAVPYGREGEERELAPLRRMARASFSPPFLFPIRTVALHVRAGRHNLVLRSQGSHESRSRSWHSCSAPTHSKVPTGHVKHEWPLTYKCMKVLKP